MNHLPNFKTWNLGLVQISFFLSINKVLNFALFSPFYIQEDSHLIFLIWIFYKYFHICFSFPIQNQLQFWHTSTLLHSVQHLVIPTNVFVRKLTEKMVLNHIVKNEFHHYMYSQFTTPHCRSTNFKIGQIEQL